MSLDAEMVKQLRDITGAGFLDCKKALIETEGNLDKACELLKQKGLTQALKKMARETKSGIIEAYIHHDKQVGVMLELNCETDFVARTDEFRSLAKEISLQITAMNPVYISRDDVPVEEVKKEKEIFETQARASGKPAQVIEKIALGKLEDYFKNICLLEQPYVKDSTKKVLDLTKDVITKTGENVTIRKFIRMKVNED